MFSLKKEKKRKEKVKREAKRKQKLVRVQVTKLPRYKALFPQRELTTFPSCYFSPQASSALHQLPKGEDSSTLSVTGIQWLVICCVLIFSSKEYILGKKDCQVQLPREGTEPSQHSFRSESGCLMNSCLTCESTCTFLTQFIPLNKMEYGQKTFSHLGENNQ